MLTTVFLDLDDTLLDFSKAEAAALHRALTELGLPNGPDVLARYHEINAAQWALLEKGELTREQVLERRFILLAQELGLTGPIAELAERYEGYLPEGCWLVPGAQALLETLVPRYALYLASNGTAAIQYRRLEKSGIGGYFQGVFLSQELGANKPGRAFFDACFAAIPGLRREEALMVGDSLTSDILGGINAGIRTCWFNPRRQPRRPDILPDWEIAALAELPALLAGEER